MLRATQLRKLTFFIIGVVAMILAVEAGILAIVHVLVIDAGQPGYKKILLLHAGVFGACLAGFSIWSYWFAGRTMACLYGSMERLQALFRTEAADRCPSAGKHQDCSPLDELVKLMEEQAGRHRETLRELERTNDFLQSIIHHNSAAIYIMDPEGRVKLVNPAFEELYGFNREDVRESLDPILPEQLKEEPQLLIGRVRSGHLVDGYETRRRTSDGREIHVSLTISPILNKKGELEALAGICWDITERRATEEILRRTEKLSVVGQLAAGVAHEIRNPLTTLRGFVQLLQQRHTGNPSHLELMLQELDRINFIVSEFIILSKPHLNHYLFKDLGALLTDVAMLLESQSHLDNIVLDTRLEPGLPKIRCEENQLKQVFLNVIKNSMEAMPEGGVVNMEARRLEHSRILVRITDLGGGIPDELLERLGEPFVTNKEHGAGLGIMISQQILANHKGQMLIRSELGKGTCVDIILPVDFEHVKSEPHEDPFPLQKAEKPA